LSPRLLLPLAVLLGSCGGSGPEGERRPWPIAIEHAPGSPPQFERVVLVTLDTLRADHVSAYGYPRRTTPFLERLAREGVVFENALAAVSQTAPSHATMLTGLVPAVHGLLANGGELDPAASDLAHMFRAAGFETAAFLNVKFLVGVAGGFDKVAVLAVGKQGGKPQVLHGEHVVQATLRWLQKERTNERFFLWVHLYDPHHWKEAMKESTETVGSIWRERDPLAFYRLVAELHGLPAFVPGQPWELSWTPEAEKFGTFETRTPEEFLHFVDAYDALVLYADQQVERLYQGLEGLGLPGRTLWIVTSDHGEGLASHGVAGHGSRIYQEQLRVPLIVHASDRSLGPRVTRELVGHVDLLPTLAETIGARIAGAPGLYEGRSLWPLIRGEAPGWTPRPLFAQRRPAEGPEDPDQNEVAALQTRTHKYIRHEPGEDEFFELERDPLELENRIGADSPEKEALRRELEARLETYRRGAPARGQTEIPEEWAEELRELGY
jgi:arylsulfatase A-like enzyme